LKDKPQALGAKEEEDIENMIRNLNQDADDDNSSQNREENDEEGMSVHLEGLEDSDLPSSTTATEEEKRASDGESDEDNQ
jgi:hypothetical protein